MRVGEIGERGGGSMVTVGGDFIGKGGWGSYWGDGGWGFYW